MGIIPPFSPGIPGAVSFLSSYTPDGKPVSSGPQWIYVSQRFNTFLSNITLTDAQMEDGRTKISGVVKCLNKHYWGIESDNTHHMLGGSWGKQTRVRPPRDIDIIFFLPVKVYNRFKLRSDNIQSQLLQEVKSVLTATYSSTTMRGDGQVVTVGFNSFMVEVVPAFELDNGKFWICDTNQNGQYKTIDPVTENKSFDTADKQWNRNARDLVRMLKTWQDYCNVPIRSFILEQLVMEFLKQWQFAGNSSFYYDWIVRDFFAYMLTRADGIILMPGTSEIISIGSDWVSRANSASKVAIIACENEKMNSDIPATSEWQKIFGYNIGRVT